MSDMEPGADPWLDVERRETQYPGGVSPNVENSRTRADTYGIRPDLFKELQEVAPKKETIDRLVASEEELGNRTDLLSPLLDYGSCYVNPDNRVHGTGWAVFSERIGPMRGCEMLTDTQGGIRLLDKGLWDIRLHLTADAFFSLPTRIVNVRIELRVYSPDGGLYSVQSAADFTEEVLTQTIVSSVVVPDSGYRVRVYVTKMYSGRGILGGPKWSRLTVQHISRDVAGGTGGESSDEPSS